MSLAFVCVCVCVLQVHISHWCVPRTFAAQETSNKKKTTVWNDTSDLRLLCCDLWYIATW